MIEWNGEPCGYTRVEFWATRTEVHELVLLPDHQNRGIGTAILRQTIARANELGVPICLQVLRENRAAVLYERLGFEEHGQTATHRLMRMPCG